MQKVAESTVLKVKGPPKGNVSLGRLALLLSENEDNLDCTHHLIFFLR